MRIQYKIPIILLCIIVGSAIINMFVINEVVLRSFEKLENNETINKAKGIEQSIQRLIENLGTKTDDWANWSDLYNYVNGLNPSFPQGNIDEQSFESLKINLIGIEDVNHKLLIAKNYDLFSKSFENIDERELHSLLHYSPDSSFDNLVNISGIVLYNKKPTLIAVRNIFKTDGTGKSGGRVLFGRYIDSELIRGITTPGSVLSGMIPAEELGSNQKYSSIYSLLKTNRYFSHTEGGLYSESYYMASDIQNIPIFIIREKFLRDIYFEGKKSISLFTWYYFGFTLFASFLFYIVIQKMILSKLSRLTQEIREIGIQKDASIQLNNYGSDEFGLVVNAFNQTRKQLEVTAREKTFQEKQYELLLNVMVEAVAVEDTHGKLRFVNKTFQRYFGYEMEEVIGKSLSELFTYADIYGKPLAADYLEDLAKRNQKGKSVAIRITGKNTSLIASISSAILLNDSTYNGLIRVFHDVTTQVEFEKQKDDFFSIASHELRTPLTVIAGSIDNILSGYGASQLSDIDKKSLQSAMKNSERLIRLVHDYLNISRIEQGRVSMKIIPMDPCELVVKLQEQFHTILQEKGIVLLFSCDHKHGDILADEDKLLEVLINLVGNSLKFTEKGSIEISHAVEGEYLITRIKDTGMGIEPEYQHMLFARFQQGSKKTISRVAEGSGLGLYISKEFLRLMGGDIWLEKSEIAIGTIFAFKLPLAKNANS